VVLSISLKIVKGKEIFYAYDDKEKEKILGKDAEHIQEIVDVDSQTAEATEEIEAEADDVKKKIPKVSIQRYKGLGEMNAEELGETTMDIKNRVLKQVHIEDAQDADKVFDILMGTDVPARKYFIQSNAKLANIDL